MKRILIFLENKQNRSLLEAWLSPQYETIVLDSFQRYVEIKRTLQDESFDLGIVDGVVLHRFWSVINARKEAERVVLPFLFVTPRQDVSLITRRLWSAVDDVVPTPIERVELRERIRVMMRMRRISLESEQRYYALAETSPVGVAIVQDGRMVYANPVCLDLLNIAQEKMPANHVLAYVHPDDRHKVRGLAEGQADEAPVEVHLADATNARWVEVHKASIAYRAKSATLFVISDVSTRKAAERQLRDAKERAEEMSRLKSALLANMSHEIRTPLTAIIGFADVMEEDVSEEMQEYVQHIRQGGKRLLDTLEGILDLAQLEGKAMKLTPRSVDVAHLAEEVLQSFRVQAQEKNVKLALQVTDAPPIVELDPDSIRRVLVNLLSNAIKFTPEGSVTVRVYAEKGQVNIQVEDTGIGIGADFVPHLFTEFKQESEGFSRSYEGSGLGLAIAKRLVELMDGEIEIESRKDEGSTFTVRLPHRAGKEAARASRKEASNGVQQEPPEAEEPPASSAAPLRILAVDDNPAMGRLVQDFTGDQYVVDVAVNGKEALQQARQVKYNVMFLDISLGPGPDGEDVLHALRQLPAYQDTILVAMTAHAMPGDRERFLQAGFNAYLSKPFSRKQLLQIAESTEQFEKRKTKEKELETTSIDEQLETCHQQGVIDRYEKTEDGIFIFGESLSFRLTSRQVKAFLHRLRRDA